MGVKFIKQEFKIEDAIKDMNKNKGRGKYLFMKVKEESEKVGLSSTFRKLRSWHLVPSLHGK